MKRTASIEHDDDFEYVGEVTKAWEDQKTGARYLRGVASGIAEDRDGERLSQRAIAKMAATSLVGGKVKATGSHEQDWLTEFGDVVSLQHDRQHDELLVDVKLPAAGEDPIADKAFKTASRERVGWSIGGKLRSSFFELVPGAVGKGGAPRRRRVLDEVALRHVMLTKKPSYRDSFAEAVAKTAKDGDTRFDDSDFFDEPDDREASDAAAILKTAAAELEARVAKAKGDGENPDDKQQALEPPDAGAAEADTPAADAPQETDTAGAGDTAPGAGDDEPSDADEAAQLPKGKGQRHLACPNCGEEFAAPLPEDVADADSADKPDQPSADDTTAKTHNQETTMSSTPLNDTLAQIRALADGGLQVTVEKTPEPTPEPTVEKSVTEATDVEKMIAASHLSTTSKVEDLAEKTAEGFTTIAKALKDVQEAVASIPQGRRSLARSGADGIEKPDGGDVAKTAPADAPLGELSREQLQSMTDEQIAKRADDDDPHAVLKAINFRDRGIR